MRGMTVAELIRRLEQQDPNAEVLYDGETNYNRATTVYELHGKVVIA